MDTIRALTGFVSRHLTKLILVVMALGLLNVKLFGGIPFNIAICASASFLMIYPMFINLKIEDVKDVGQYKGVVSASILLNFVVSPLLAYLLGRAFFADQPFMALGLMLIALLPTSGMTATWTELANGELKAALSIIAISLILIVAGLPFALPLAAGDRLSVTPFFIFQRVLLVIVVPLILGDITRRQIIARKGMAAFKTYKPVFSGLSSTGLLFVLFLIMSLDSNRLLLAEPMSAIRALAPLSMYYISLFALSTVVGQLFPRRVGIALAYGTSVRYLALALGIAIPLLGNGTNSSQVVFVVALSFFIQVPLSSLYGRWISGPASA